MVDDVVYANLLLYMQSLLNMAILTLDLDPCHPHILNKHSNFEFRFNMGIAIQNIDDDFYSLCLFYVLIHNTYHRQSLNSGSEFVFMYCIFIHIL